MPIRGRFILYDARGTELERVDNMITTEGATQFLQMLLQGDASVIAAGGNFYVGLCGNTVAVADTMASIIGEPTVTNGYARAACTRDTTGFPTIGAVNTVIRAQSKGLAFSAAGGNFSTSFQRLFLCSSAAGAGGKLYAYSGALTIAYTVVNGTSYVARYELYIN